MGCIGVLEEILSGKNMFNNLFKSKKSAASAPAAERVERMVAPSRERPRPARASVYREANVDEANFKAKTGALVEQYNALCPLDEGETCVNGSLTLGENIGDLGGLSMAYKAYKLSLDTDGDGTISAEEEAPVIDGLTGDQRFFLSWAQVWRSKYREEATRRQLLTDPHSPPVYRVNGVVRNLAEWYDAFNVTEDNEMYLPPEQRIRIW